MFYFLKLEDYEQKKFSSEKDKSNENVLAPKSLTRPTFEHHYLRFIQDALLLVVKLEFEYFNYISPQNPTSDFLFWESPI